jgi:hypothetical protein
VKASPKSGALILDIISLKSFLAYQENLSTLSCDSVV